jgi:hypothetical protein
MLARPDEGTHSTKDIDHVKLLQIDTKGNRGDEFAAGLHYLTFVHPKARGRIPRLLF